MTRASWVENSVAQIVPHVPLTLISTRPSLLLLPSARHTKTEPLLPAWATINGQFNGEPWIRLRPDQRNIATETKLVTGRDMHSHLLQAVV